MPFWLGRARRAWRNSREPALASIVTKFWQVEFYHSPWPTDLLTRDVRWTVSERLAKCSAAVGKAYSEALREGDPVEAATSWGRFIFDEGATEFRHGTVAATTDLGMGEVHFVPPPPARWLDLPDRERRSVLLDLLHDLLLQLADARGWPHAPFEAARERVLVDGLGFSLVSPPKSSPDRRHKAHITMRIDGDGDAWLDVVIVDREGQEAARSAPAPTGESVRNFNAAKASLKWLTSSSVTVRPWPIEPPPSGYRRAVTVRL